MIGSAGTGADFRGLARYLLREREGEERVGWALVRNLPGDERHAAALMEGTAAQNVRVEKPVYHLSLSAAPGEELSRKQWEKVVDRVLRDLGLEEHQALVVRHTDAQHDHVHLMVNRVHPDHLKAWHNGHDYRRIERSLRGIEREMGLREVPGRHGRLAGQERPERGELTSGERREKERTGREAWAERVKFQVYEDLKEAKSWAELERRLARHRLRLEKRGPGLVVTDGRRRVKASRLYRGASYGQLEKRFGQSFDEWRAAKRELVAAVDRMEKVERRRDDLERRQEVEGRTIRAARSTIDEARRARAASRQIAREIERHLARTYRPEDLARARRELVREARQRGWEQAGRRLAREPARFGRVRGAGVGRFETAQRTAARRSAVHLAGLAAQLAAFRGARAVLGPEATRAVGRLRRVVRAAERTAKAVEGCRRGASSSSTWRRRR